MVNDTEQSKTEETEINLIAKRAAGEPECQFNNLKHLISEEFLKANYYQLRRNGAEGMDEVSWKEYGKQRPIGIPTTEDKFVQKAMSKIMEAMYEQDFYEGSYGFRPGRSCHQALRKVGELINFKLINHVIEADIKGFFDKVDHKKLTELLGRKIKDPKFLQYVVRFLKSGYIEEEVIKESKEGTPQGGNISPMLANIFLHYVLDEWFEKEVKAKLKGQL